MPVNPWRLGGLEEGITLILLPSTCVCCFTLGGHPNTGMVTDRQIQGAGRYLGLNGRWFFVGRSFCFGMAVARAALTEVSLVYSLVRELLLKSVPKESLKAQSTHLWVSLTGPV